MGITGLHKGLQFCTRKGSIREFSGQRVAVDASSWLHKSVYSIAPHYVEAYEKGKLDSKCIETSAKYVISRCQELLTHAGIERIYLVFDGKRCPLKLVTNQDREARRNRNLDDARRYRQEGRLKNMEERYKACIKVSDKLTQEVARRVQERFRRPGGVELVWSPYEADAQMVKLCMEGTTQAVITEDSDVLVYSASVHKAFPTVFKLDRATGACDIVSMDWLISPSANFGGRTKMASGMESILESFATRQNRRPGFGVRLFVQACVLAGCDYAPSQLHGVGLVKAFKHIRDNAHRPCDQRFRGILSSLDRKTKSKVDTLEYEEQLARSEAVFYYHVTKSVRGHLETLQAPVTKSGSDDKLKYYPIMTRFDRDWSFLGSLGETTVLKQIENKPDVMDLKSPLPPVQEVVIPPKNKSLVLQSKFSKESRHGTEINVTGAVMNPYAKSKIAKTGSDSTVTTKTLTMSGRSEGSSLFAGFAHRARKSNAKFFKGDVRFVKRTFPKDSRQSHDFTRSSVRNHGLHLSKVERRPSVQPQVEVDGHSTEDFGVLKDSTQLRTNTIVSQEQSTLLPMSTTVPECRTFDLGKQRENSVSNFDEKTSHELSGNTLSSQTTSSVLDEKGSIYAPKDDTNQRISQPDRLEVADEQFSFCQESSLPVSPCLLSHSDSTNHREEPQYLMTDNQNHSSSNHLSATTIEHPMDSFTQETPDKFNEMTSPIVNDTFSNVFRRPELARQKQSTHPSFDYPSPFDVKNSFNGSSSKYFGKQTSIDQYSPGETPNFGKVGEAFAIDLTTEDCDALGTSADLDLQFDYEIDDKQNIPEDTGMKCDLSLKDSPKSTSSFVSNGGPKAKTGTTLKFFPRKRAYPNSGLSQREKLRRAQSSKGGAKRRPPLQPRSVGQKRSKGINGFKARGTLFSHFPIIVKEKDDSFNEF